MKIDMNFLKAAGAAFIIDKKICSTPVSQKFKADMYIKDKIYSVKIERYKLGGGTVYKVGKSKKELDEVLDIVEKTIENNTDLIKTFLISTLARFFLSITLLLAICLLTLNLFKLMEACNMETIVKLGCYFIAICIANILKIKTYS